MNLLDPLLIIFFIVCALIGYFLGIAKSLGYLGSLAIAFAFSRLLTLPLFGLIGGIFGENQDTGKMVIFVILFVLCSLGLQFIIRTVDHRKEDEKAIGERIIAAVLFSLCSTFFVGILLLFVEAYTANCSLESTCIESLQWLHTTIESALIAPSLVTLIASIFKMFV